jgi:hypothetical protein
MRRGGTLLIVAFRSNIVSQLVDHRIPVTAQTHNKLASEKPLALLHQASQQGRTVAIRALDAKVLDRSRHAAAGFDPTKRAGVCATDELSAPQPVDAFETTPGDVQQSFGDPVEAPVIPTLKPMHHCPSMSEKKRQLAGSAHLSADERDPWFAFASGAAV